jgi:hypothetical protein
MLYLDWSKSSAAFQQFLLFILPRSVGRIHRPLYNVEGYLPHINPPFFPYLTELHVMLPRLVILSDVAFVPFFIFYEAADTTSNKTLI